MKKRYCSLAVMVFVVAQLSGADEAPKSAEPGTLVVIDQNGKEQKLKSWKFAAGTRRLTWLAPPAKDEEPNKDKDKDKDKDPVEAKAKVPAGPEALEFRDDKSTNLAKGIVYLIPIERIRSLDFDNEQRSATVRVAVSDKSDDDIKLTGTTKYKGENQVAIEAEVDKGDMGVAEIKFQGGLAKGIRGIRFPPAKAGETPKGRVAVITANDKEKTTHKVVDIQALYHLTDGSLKPLPTLQFKKTLKLDLAKVKKIHFHPTNAKEGTTEADVTMADGEEHTLNLLRTISLDEKPAVLEGLIGKTPAGYKLFPVATVLDLQFEAGDKK